MHAETLEEERSWLESARSERERHRAQLLSAPDAAASPRQAGLIKRNAAGHAERLGEPHEPAAIGRIDFADDDDVLYIGRHAILDEDKNLLVINWKQEVAQPFYRASIADPLGLRRKRTFHFDGPRLIDFDEAVFADLASRLATLDGEAHEAAPDDALLRDLERSRTGEMQDIVQTIQAAQDEVVRASPRQLLIVQGGPGTGKTAVALHRVSWLLFNFPDELTAKNVLVVGPSPIFTRYTRTVLPSLGDTDIQQLSIGQLGPESSRGPLDEPDTARIKGDARMAGLLRRAVRQRIRIPEDADNPSLRIGRSAARFQPQELRVLTDTLITEFGYSGGRLEFRRWLSDEESERARAVDRKNLGAPQGEIDNFVERVWPQLSPAMLLQELLGSRERLLQAAGTDFSASEVQALYRQSAPRISEERWTDADVALLDECDHLLGRAPTTYGHIVVDEAQDLSPMQLRSLRRRSADGSMTIVGDIAQSTSAWARDSWEEIEETLAQSAAVSHEELRVGYRVPQEIFAIAERLLPVAAPAVTPPRIIRRSGEDPALVRCDENDQAIHAVAAAREAAGRGCSVGLICPDVLRGELEASMRRQGVQWADGGTGNLGASINLIRPHEAKGLEFDAVVVVEPEAIVAAYPQGLRMLYVAYTRSTKYLSIIHHGSVLPGIEATPIASQTATDVAPSDSDVASSESSSVSERPGPPGEARSAAPPRIIRAAAADLAEQILDGVPHEHWEALLSELRKELLGSDGSGDSTTTA